MRLIDADALKNDILKSAVMIDDRGIQTGYEIAIELIKRQPTIDAVPLDGSFLKMSRGDYLIYKRHWLYEHFDMEMDIQRSAMKSMGYEPALKDAEPRWIPCSERLPEAPFGCLVTVEDEEPMTGALFPNLLPYFVGWDGEQWNDADGEQCPFEVLAWMPLPKPYEVKE